MERFFANPTEFAIFMERAIAFELFADTAGRTAAAILITREVKDRIGKADLLPPPLADATQAEREHLGYSRDETLLREGGLRDSYHWAHESTRKTVVGSDEKKAVWHEFGTTRGAPARAPLSRTMHDHDDSAFAAFVAAFGRNFTPK
jgi:hypothetical protein